MFSSSLRRVARSVPVTAAPSRTLVTPAVLATNSHGYFATKKHQRRNSSSSSKPPVPPSDGSRGIDVGAPNKEVAQASEKKAGRRKAKDTSDASGKKNDPFMNVPSVPSTQHLHPHDVHVASFFSIHRPMSVTTSVPGNSNAEAFSSIFSGTSKKGAKAPSSDVIFTLSSAVDTLESAAQQTQHEDAHSEGVTHLDGAPFGDMKISVEEITRSFRPFNPPPPPEPMSMEESNAAVEAESASDSLESYSTVLTIRERFDESGERTWDAHTTPFVKIEEPATEFADEEHQAPAMVPRGSFTRRMQREKMQAISVKRQRKLKMKKHKYKKLMKKTRSLRKRLDKN